MLTKDQLSPEQRRFLLAVWPTLKQPWHHFTPTSFQVAANLSQQEVGRIVDELEANGVIGEVTDDYRAKLSEDGQELCRRLMDTPKPTLFSRFWEWSNHGVIAGLIVAALSGWAVVAWQHFTAAPAPAPSTAPASP